MPRPRPPGRSANPPECTARANRSVRRLIVDRRASHNRFPLRIDERTASLVSFAIRPQRAEASALDFARKGTVYRETDD